MPDRVGRQLGNYRLTKFLGQGAFAEVYLGQHIYLNTQAAIKILKGQITSQERQIFQKEAQMVAQLRHPNIVRILEFGIENNFPFLIMDYLPGTMRGDIRFGERRGVSRVASSSSDKTVQIWEAKSGRNLYTYTGHTEAVAAVSWSPDGTRIASGASDGLQIWEVKSGRVLYRYDGHSRKIVGAISWSPDGTRIASGAADNTMQIWEAKSGRKLYTCIGHTDAVMTVRWSPGGTRLASSSNDKTVRVWEAKSGRILCTYRGHSGQVYGLAWSPDGSRLASGSLDETVQIWQAE